MFIDGKVADYANVYPGGFEWMEDTLGRLLGCRMLVTAPLARSQLVVEHDLTPVRALPPRKIAEIWEPAHRHGRGWATTQDHAIPATSIST